ncbi:hypothetical protein EON65_46720 [archaeon]|nr:MAG: hypothetical protein EON65_46720 [archaeon]
MTMVPPTIALIRDSTSTPPLVASRLTSTHFQLWLIFIWHRRSSKVKCWSCVRYLYDLVAYLPSSMQCIFLADFI